MRIQLPLNLAGKPCPDVLVGGESLDFKISHPATEFEQSTLAFQSEAGKGEPFERAFDYFSETTDLRRARNAHHVDGNVRMKIVPVKHRFLKTVQLPSHRGG